MKHGLAGHRLYKVWRDMRERCENSNHKAYHRYGGRGIAVCERWQRVENFVADMAPSFQEGLTLDRSDNNRGYSPDNCAWATRLEQNQNRENTVRLAFGGRSLTFQEWSIDTGVRRATLIQRIGLGWSVERTLTTPVRPKNPPSE